MGIRIEDAIISCMCFADDLILISDNNEDMNLLLKICEAFFDEKHLKVNALKCQSLRSTPVKNKKAMKVESEIHRWWKGIPIHSFSYERFSKYLGVTVGVNPRGEIILPMEDWDSWLNNIKKAALEPQQKIIAIKSVIIPKLLHKQPYQKVS